MSCPGYISDSTISESITKANAVDTVLSKLWPKWLRRTMVASTCFGTNSEHGDVNVTLATGRTASNEAVSWLDPQLWTMLLRSDSDAIICLFSPRRMQLPLTAISGDTGTLPSSTTTTLENLIKPDEIYRDADVCVVDALGAFPTA